MVETLPFFAKVCKVICVLLRSRPARGAWIEIPILRTSAFLSSGRAPQGARGLKSFFVEEVLPGDTSRPVRGVWIEMAELNLRAP